MKQTLNVELKKERNAVARKELEIEEAIAYAKCISFSKDGEINWNSCDCAKCNCKFKNDKRRCIDMIKYLAEQNMLK